MSIFQLDIGDPFLWGKQEYRRNSQLTASKWQALPHRTAPNAPATGGNRAKKTDISMCTWFVFNIL